MRFLEIGLLALPFVVFALWRILSPNAGPPKVLVVGLVAGVLPMGVLLLVLRYEDAAPPDAVYVPPRLENGRVVPGYAERVTPAENGAPPTKR